MSNIPPIDPATKRYIDKVTAGIASQLDPANARIAKAWLDEVLAERRRMSPHPLEFPRMTNEQKELAFECAVRAALDIARSKEHDPVAAAELVVKAAQKAASLLSGGAAESLPSC